MTTSRIPGFSAESTLNKSNAPYQVSAMLSGLRQGGEGIIHPALPYFGCRWFTTMKGQIFCCWAPGYVECA